jgi:hypothetical protein
MIKSLLHMTAIALVGLVATEASAAPVAWSGSMDPNITATVPEGAGVPLVIVCQRGAEAVAVLAAVVVSEAVAAAVIAAVAAVPGPVPAEATSVAPM